MFTGLIQSVGGVVSLVRRGRGARLVLRARFEDGPLALGESVAVDGICLTAARCAAGRFEADLSEETLARSTAGSWRRGRRVNLERALTPTSRIGGHFVQGHVDGRGRVLALAPAKQPTLLRVAYPRDLASLLAYKGSIAVDGVSLTVASLARGWFEVALVPHTVAATNLADRRPGDEVNLEVDLLARHLARLLLVTGHSRGNRPHTGSVRREEGETRRRGSGE